MCVTLQYFTAFATYINNFHSVSLVDPFQRSLRRTRLNDVSILVADPFVQSFITLSFHTQINLFKDTSVNATYVVHTEVATRNYKIHNTDRLHDGVVGVTFIVNEGWAWSPDDDVTDFLRKSGQHG